jgi:hypothetical protein
MWCCHKNSVVRPLPVYTRSPIPIYASRDRKTTRDKVVPEIRERRSLKYKVKYESKGTNERRTRSRRSAAGGCVALLMPLRCLAMPADQSCGRNQHAPDRSHCPPQHPTPNDRMATVRARRGDAARDVDHTMRDDSVRESGDESDVMDNIVFKRPGMCSITVIYMQIF